MMEWIKVNNNISQRDVKIFALSTCIWCKKTKKLMDDNNITYKYLDVDLLNNEDKQEAVSEMKKHINNISFPLIVIDNEIAIKGFQEKELRSTLNV